jgi:hypothetical protein
MNRLLVALAALAVAALAAGCTRMRGAATIPNNPGIRIVPEDEARPYAKQIVPLAIPFGSPGNGTKLISDLLERLESRGAKYVSGLTFYMIFRRDGVAVECRTQAVFPGESIRKAGVTISTSPVDSDEDVYTTSVEPIKPASFRVRITEPELRCRRVGKQVKKRVPRYDNPFDVEVARSRGGPVPIDEVIDVEWHDECAMELITRDALRFDYQIRLGWVPPDWAYISGRWADFTLVETEPSCYRIDEEQVAQLAAHRVEATVYFVGDMPNTKHPTTPLQNRFVLPSYKSLQD